MTHVPNEASVRPSQKVDLKQVTPSTNYINLLKLGPNHVFTASLGLTNGEMMHLVPPIFTSYFFDDHTNQFTSVRVNLPSGIVMEDISHH